MNGPGAADNTNPSRKNRYIMQVHYGNRYISSQLPDLGTPVRLLYHAFARACLGKSSHGFRNRTIAKTMIVLPFIVCLFPFSRAVPTHSICTNATQGAFSPAVLERLTRRQEQLLGRIEPWYRQGSYNLPLPFGRGGLEGEIAQQQQRQQQQRQQQQRSREQGLIQQGRL